MGDKFWLANACKSLYSNLHCEKRGASILSSDYIAPIKSHQAKAADVDVLSSIGIS